MASLGNKLELAAIRRKLARVGYYARNVARDIAPQFLFRQRLPRILDTAGRYDAAYLSQRVAYCNKLSKPLDAQQYASTVASIPLNKSMFYYDLKEHARYFPRSLQLNHLFGDIAWISDRPAFVKARPIAGDNRNSILFKLDKFRHFYFPADRTAFLDKRPLAVWRGTANNQKRINLLERYADHPLCDVGLTGRTPDGPWFKAFLTPADQLQFRYVISIEGHDVATNLKWVMASNSLCFMPAPVHETWFMEGRLEAGRHYVMVRDDFEDLEEKILHYERNTGDALQIVRNANSYVAPFHEEACEQLVSLLVLYKYFVVTGQLEADARIAQLIT